GDAPPHPLPRRDALHGLRAEHAARGRRLPALLVGVGAGQRDPPLRRDRRRALRLQERPAPAREPLERSRPPGPARRARRRPPREPATPPPRAPGGRADVTTAPNPALRPGFLSKKLLRRGRMVASGRGRALPASRGCTAYGADARGP